MFLLWVIIMINLEKMLEKTTGTTGLYFRRDDRLVFFKPLDSSGEFLLKTATVVTMPIVSTGMAVTALLVAGWELLKAIGNLVTLNFDRAGKNITDCRKFLHVMSITLLAAAVSPLLNFVDLIGSTIASIKPALSSEPSEEIFQLSC
jgi:hypothetical protein